MAESEEDSEETLEDTSMSITNLIFLPFHPIFQLLVLVVVILRCIFGPVQSVFPIIYCTSVMNINNSVFYAFIRYLYLYVCAPFYGIDTFLHILHRQITDEAVKQKHLPKSGYLLLVDIVSLIPFYRLMTTDMCPPIQLWPNILSFNEFLTIYRVMKYFSLVGSHSLWKMITGFMFLTILTINCIGCLFLLLTANGLCKDCKDNIYDWRQFVETEINETEMGFTTYIYGISFVFSLIFKTAIGNILPSTILEFFISSTFIIIGYTISTFFIFPKLFAESLLEMRRIREFQSPVKRIIEETKIRNPSQSAYVDVQNFYSLVWQTHAGVTQVPKIITQLPRYLRIDIKQDIFWPVFYHSPTFRKTSEAHKRWLCDFIQLDYKLPGETFFAGPYCRTNLYYLRTGIVQFISSEDGKTPILSLTSGTVFGDISFLLPPLKRKVTVLCLTYCEVFYISRADILKSLHMYPEDRFVVMQKATERIKHARELNVCKKHVRGLDRSEDEGISWIKRRWWEISDVVSKWKKKILKTDIKYELPPEEVYYHCSKYIGQLVLCKEIQLQNQPLFSNAKFPWILTANSLFGKIWNHIVVSTVFLVLILYPYNLAKTNNPKWFIFFQYFTNFVYIFDICVSLLTSTEKQENVTSTFIEVMFERFKSPQFILDIVATIWTENVALIVGKPEYYNVCQYNRLVKIYILFYEKYTSMDYIHKDPLFQDLYKIALANFSTYYIAAYFTHVLSRYLPLISASDYFKDKSCLETIRDDKMNDTVMMPLAWTFLILYMNYPCESIVDIYTGIVLGFLIFVIIMFCKSRMIASIFLKHKEESEYRFFVTNLKKYYKFYKVHPQLLKRLDDHFSCHWKYFKGMDVMCPNIIGNEPFHLYWKVYGESAAKVISKSKAFLNADPNLIKELAFKARFLLLPKGSTLIFLGIQQKNVSWIVRGSVTCEYYTEKEELQNHFYPLGEIISLGSIFLGKPALKTYTAHTDCEMLYIKMKDFMNILKRFPFEWTYIENCKAEFAPIYKKMYEEYLNKNKHYQKKLRDKIFQARMSVKLLHMPQIHKTNLFYSFVQLLRYPSSRFIRYWMTFRAISVFISILCASFEGGSGAIYRKYLCIINNMCIVVTVIDILIKMFMAYFDERGLLISSRNKCMIHYITRGFLMDIIGILPWHKFIIYIPTKQLDESAGLLINTLSKFAHLYMITGYLDYLADIPSVTLAWIKLIKWQICMILLSFGASHYFVSKCVSFKWDAAKNLIHMERFNHCWLPDYVKTEQQLSPYQLHMIFAHSFVMTQIGVLTVNLGNYHIEYSDYDLIAVIFILRLGFWCVMCYSVTLVVLQSRGNVIFRQAVQKLKLFLEAERIEKSLIIRAVAHFRYWWQRTNGINLQNLITERIGVVFKQDLSYYFYKNTLSGLDALIEGDESVQRELASTSTQLYFLPKEIIMREKDLTPWVYVVHKGKVIISGEGKQIAVLTKGSLFGQLENIEPRPVRVTAETVDYADVLQISTKDFQNNINDEIRQKIASSSEFEFDYIPIKEPIYEDPRYSIEFLLQRPKTIHLPIKSKTLTARSGSWFSRWLVLVWIVAPFTASVLVLIINNVSSTSLTLIYVSLFLLDIIHLMQILLEFFEIKLVIVNDVCVKQLRHWRTFRDWQLYVDILSLTLPMMTIFTNELNYQLFRLLRLRLFYDFYQQFCRSFKTKISIAVMNFIIVFLIFHTLICGWMLIACQDHSDFPYVIPDHMKPNLTKIDSNQWSPVTDRKKGCAKLFDIKMQEGETKLMYFVVPKDWFADYIVAMLYIILNYSGTNLNLIFPLKLSEVYYKIFATHVMYLIYIWLSSLTFSTMYMKLRELFQYDYDVSKLLMYLKHAGLSPVLLQIVKEYTDQLWRREKGKWLPELAKQSHICLKEDLLGAIYMHHFEAIPLFRNLPHYFTRQLVTRLNRVVIFPEKCIMQTGDIFPCIYFIHEGEVEKWQKDSNGKERMVSLLSTKDCFGLIPGLYPDTPYKHSYHSRTVVDLVYLKYKHWQDLLKGYPEVNDNLYTAARQLKKDLGMT